MPGDEKEIVWIDGLPKCPCGSHLFDTTFQLLGEGKWLLEWVSCASCYSSIKITPEFEKWIRDQKWKVRKESMS